MLTGMFVTLATLAATTRPTSQVLRETHIYQSTLVSTIASKIHIFSSRTDGTIFAVKEFMSDAGLDYSYKTEFDIGKSLSNHANIVTIHELFHENEKRFQLMEYLPQSLRDWVVNMEGVPSADEVACVFRQLLDAVSYMHSQGVVHLDLKLPNAMFSGNISGSNVKIIDFGSATRYRGVNGGVVLQRGPVGTLPFLPPEVFDKAYDPRKVDIWALALMYCQMLKPYLPWRRATLSSEVRHFGIFSFSAVGAPDEEDMNNTCELFRETVNSMLYLLPIESRGIIRRMLEPDPHVRVGWTEIWADAWVSRIICKAGEDGDEGK